MSPGRGPLDAPTADEWRRARVRAARQHHPDVGGDVDAYLQALRAVDVQFGVGDHGTTHVHVHRDGSLRARLARAASCSRRAGQRVLVRVPQRWRPGPTYIDL